MKILLLLLTFFYLGGCEIQAQNSNLPDSLDVYADSVYVNFEDSLDLEDLTLEPLSVPSMTALLQEAHSHLNTRYCASGKKPSTGFDCSGFVHYCYDQTFGINLPVSSREYKKVGKKVSIKNAQPGDIICFTGRNARSRQLGHVGIVIENSSDIYFIHSASQGGIRVDRLSQKYYKDRFRSIRRISNLSN
jgi:hypothetical protein